MSEGSFLSEEEYQLRKAERPIPEPPRATRTTTRRPENRRQPGPKAPPRARKRPSTPKSEPEHTVEEAVRGILQLPAAGFVIAGQRTQSVPLVADGATILIHGPGVAKAIADIAENDPRVMVLLEKVLAFGPYGALLAVLFPMVAQFARNHGGPAPILDGFGAVEPEQVITAASLDIPTDVSPDGQVSSGDQAPAA